MKTSIMLKFRRYFPCVSVTLVLFFVVYGMRLDRNEDLKELQSLEDRVNDLQIRLDAMVKQQEQNQKISAERINQYRDINPKFRPLDNKKATAKHGRKHGRTIDNKEGQIVSPQELIDVKNLVIPVLVMACNRVTVTKALDSLLKYNPDLKRFPVIVSQDCGHEETSRAIDQYKSVLHIKHTNLTKISGNGADYGKISRHYIWALTQVFDVLNYEAVIIVEDDLEVSPDFFEYFLATYPLLKQDSSLFCVSAWNDNGKAEHVDSSKPELLYRTDFFPGLGWMLTKSFFKEVQPKWPTNYWDDWMRLPEQSQGRSCIRPEIPRTSTFGRVGVSKGQFFDAHLKHIERYLSNVHFTEMDLSYLLKWNYDQMFEEALSAAAVITLTDLMQKVLQYDTVKVEYKNNKEFTAIAKSLSIMSDFKSGIPRTAYKGVVTLVYNGIRVYLVPTQPWKGYSSKMT